MKINKIVLLFLITFSAACFAQIKNTTKPSQQNAAAADTIAVNTTAVNAIVADTTAEVDSVSISQLVASQIAAARQKQISDSTSAAKAPVLQPEPAHTRKSENGSGITEAALRFYNANTNIVLKIAFLLTVSLIAFTVILIRRKSKPKEEFGTTLKKNIRMLREEKIEFSINPELKMMRKRLIRDPSLNFSSRDSISQIARELNISKGELMLAARIRSHEMVKNV